MTRLTKLNVALNLLYYGITVIAIPWIILRVESLFGYGHTAPMPLIVFAVALGITGAGLQLWSITALQIHGAGTPSPVFSAKNLVIQPPYSWLRNPLNLGEVLLLLGLAALFASPGLATYAALAAFCFHAFIVAWEEPRHRERFGEPYATYASRTNRWVPRWKSGPRRLRGAPSTIGNRGIN